MTSRSPSDRSPSTNNPREDRAVLGEFGLAPGLVHLNHGSFGAVPRSVDAVQSQWRAHIESNPTGFFKDELPGLMRGTAGHVARRFGGAANDWVFCENATSAVNGILGSLDLGPGDEIATTSHAYGAVAKAMRLWAERRGAGVAVAELPAHLTDDDEAVAAIAAVLGPRTRLLVIDHITSATAIVLPVGRIAERAHRAGVPVLVDGAHAPGHIPLDVPGVGADWYTGNAHKWLFAPRGCGLLWTAPERQNRTFPAILSHGTGAGYLAAFDWVGTRDVTPWLCFESGAAAHDGFGGGLLMDRNRQLAVEGAAIFGEITGATPAAPAAMRGAMAALDFGNAPTDPNLPPELQRALARRHGIVVPVHGFAGKLWLRISAQVYNEPDDYRRCAEAFRTEAGSLGFLSG